MEQKCQLNCELTGDSCQDFANFVGLQIQIYMNAIIDYISMSRTWQTMQLGTEVKFDA